MIRSCVNKIQRNCYLGDFAVSADHTGKMKERNKNRQILGSCQRAEKKLWNIKMTVTPMILGILGTVPKGLEKRLVELEIRERMKMMEMRALLRSARILRRVLETCCHSYYDRGNHGSLVCQYIELRMTRSLYQAVHLRLA